MDLRRLGVVRLPEPAGDLAGSGFVVLADRYIYTALARDVVRSGDRKWIRDVFGFALVPDLVCYLRIDVETLALRVIETSRMNYWESGMDLKLGTDLYDSFKKYQMALIEEFDKMAEEFGWAVIDARKSPDHIQESLRARIEPVLKGGDQELAFQAPVPGESRTTDGSEPTPTAS